MCSVGHYPKGVWELTILLLQRVGSAEFEARFQQVYGVSLDEAEREWRAFCAAYRPARWSATGTTGCSAPAGQLVDRRAEEKLRRIQSRQDTGQAGHGIEWAARCPRCES